MKEDEPLALLPENEPPDADELLRDTDEPVDDEDAELLPEAGTRYDDVAAVLLDTEDELPVADEAAVPLDTLPEVVVLLDTLPDDVAELLEALADTDVVVPLDVPDMVPALTAEEPEDDDGDAEDAVPRDADAPLDAVAPAEEETEAEPVVAVLLEETDDERLIAVERAADAVVAEDDLESPADEVLLCTVSAEFLCTVLAVPVLLFPRGP